jgi:ABC-type antimicrobial peptide transport system ATPase subunit
MVSFLIDLRLIQEKAWMKRRILRLLHKVSIQGFSSLLFNAANTKLLLLGGN